MQCCSTVSSWSETGQVAISWCRMKRVAQLQSHKHQRTISDVGFALAAEGTHRTTSPPLIFYIAKGSLPCIPENPCAGYHSARRAGHIASPPMLCPAGPLRAPSACPGRFESFRARCYRAGRHTAPYCMLLHSSILFVRWVLHHSIHGTTLPDLSLSNRFWSALCMKLASYTHHQWQPASSGRPDELC